MPAIRSSIEDVATPFEPSVGVDGAAEKLGALN